MLLKTNELRVDNRIRLLPALNGITIKSNAEYVTRHNTNRIATVFYDGNNYWLASEFDYVDAVLYNNMPLVECDVTEGGFKEAFFHSLSVAKLLPWYGLQVKKNAIAVLIRDLGYENEPNKDIGELCGVSQSYVSEVRKELGIKRVVPKQSEEERRAKNRERARIDREKKRLLESPKPPRIKISEEEKKRRVSESNRKYRESHKDPVKELEKARLKEEQLARKLEREKPKPPKWGIKAYWEQHPEIKTKTCSGCGKIRPETEEYFYYIQREDRLQNSCKQCADSKKRRDKTQRERPEVRARQNEYCRHYREAHKEDISPERQAQLNKKSRQYYWEHHEEILQRRKELFEQNKDEVKEKRKAWSQTEKGRKAKAKNRRRWKQNRRAREKGLEASLTAKQWEDCKSFFNGCCAYCGKETDMTMDHFIAVANGGEYSRDNALPACCDCNSSKRDIDFFIWYPAQPFYSKMREKRIIKYLNYKGEGLQQRTLFG